MLFFKSKLYQLANPWFSSAGFLPALPSLFPPSASTFSPSFFCSCPCLLCLGPLSLQFTLKFVLYGWTGNLVSQLWLLTHSFPVLLYFYILKCILLYLGTPGKLFSAPSVKNKMCWYSSSVGTWRDGWIYQSDAWNFRLRIYCLFKLSFILWVNNLKSDLDSELSRKDLWKEQGISIQVETNKVREDLRLTAEIRCFVDDSRSQ